MDNHSPDTLYQEKEFEKSVRKGLEGLSEGPRAVFVLKEIEGLGTIRYFLFRSLEG